MILRDQQRVGFEIEEEIQKGDNDVRDRFPNMFLLMLIGRWPHIRK